MSLTDRVNELEKNSQASTSIPARPYIVVTQALFLWAQETGISDCVLNGPTETSLPEGGNLVRYLSVLPRGHSQRFSGIIDWGSTTNALAARFIGGGVGSSCGPSYDVR